jgi:nucleoside-diphosphate-sugar epimerase
MATWVILGCGYVGTRLARALLADGHEVRAGARDLSRMQSLGEAGALLFAIDATRRRSFGPLMYAAPELHVVFSIPPVPGGPPGVIVARAAEAAQAAGARSFVYLGSTAVYGETPSGELVDEDTPLATADPEAAARIAEETAVDAARLAGLRTVILRLAAIYGPGRGVRERLKKGDYQLVDDGVHYYSRVHVDDLVGVIRVAAERAPAGARYCVADDRPSTQREYVDWLCGRLGLPSPPSVASLAPGAQRRPVRNRRIDNQRLRRELGYAFRYPTYREGELAIEAEQGSARSAPPTSTPLPLSSLDERKLSDVADAATTLLEKLETLSPEERTVARQRLASALASIAVMLGR